MGAELIETVCTATGLPKELIQTELHRILMDEGIDADEVTIEELRVALAKYLQEVLLGAKNSL